MVLIYIAPLSHTYSALLPDRNSYNNHGGHMMCQSPSCLIPPPHHSFHSSCMASCYYLEDTVLRSRVQSPADSCSLCLVCFPVACFAFFCHSQIFVFFSFTSSESHSNKQSILNRRLPPFLLLYTFIISILSSGSIEVLGTK